MGVEQERLNGWLLASVRMLLGLMWVQNVGWKLPPQFGALGRFVQRGIDDPTLPAFSWGLREVVQPNLVAFGWVVLVSELLLGVGLLFGIATRLWAAFGALQSLSIGLTVARVPDEWGWSYWLMVAAHVAVFASPAAGRVWSLDAVLRARAVGTGRLHTAYLGWAS
ncbi:MAG: TQO small subunit DoxD [Acidimicrobiales bacterium]